MEVNLLKRLKFIDNDVYIIHSFANKLLINNNYDGIVILNQQLHKLSQISIIQNLCIERIYNQLSASAILIYAYENNCFIHFNINTLDWFKIAIELDDVLFSPVYWWQNTNEVILTTYSKQLFSLNISNKLLIPVSENTLEKNYPKFYPFWVYYKSKSIINFYPLNGISLIYKNEHSIILFDFLKNREKEISIINPKMHEIIYNNGIICFISEDQVIINYEKSKKTLKTKNPYIFTHGIFSNNSLVLLQNNQSKTKNNIISTYEIKKF